MITYIILIYIIIIFLGRDKIKETEQYIISEFGAKAESS